MNRLRTSLPSALLGSIALLIVPAGAATFTWNVSNSAADWGTASSWSPAQVPPSNPATDLIFGGNVASGTYVANNNLGVISPFILNQITLNGIDASPQTSGLSHSIQGGAIRFVGADAGIAQAGSANMVINTPLLFEGALAFSGNGAGTVTMNNGISGVGDITKTGTSTFRFGTIPTGVFETPSSNTWVGKLIIDDGTVRFNNNAQSAASALRANPVHFGSTGFGVLTAQRNQEDEDDGVDTSLRMGTLSSDFGIGEVTAVLDGTKVSNFDIVITALHNGTFGGTITIPAPLGVPGDLGNDGGALTIRGPGVQTLNGTLNLYKDTVVGHGATLVLAGNASVNNASGTGAITFAGGTVILDNTLNDPFGEANRLRDDDDSSTTVETVGGGTLRLRGDSDGTTETTGRLQLGSASQARSGHLKVQVEIPASQPTNTGPLTQLQFAGISRNQTVVKQLATIEFAGLRNGAPIGIGGAATRIVIGGVSLSNSLLNVTAGTANVGWATVNSSGSVFYATHGVQGIAAYTGASVWSGTQTAATNVQISGTQPGGGWTTSGTGTNATVNSLRMAPSGSGQTLTIAGADVLSTTAFLLAGATDFAIQATGSGKVGGNGPRFFYVQSANLTVAAPLNGTNHPVVKSGDGTLTLSGNNTQVTEPTAINGGVLRVAAANSLPSGELRFRGGQLEIETGGTFSRNLGFGEDTVNWTGVQLVTGTPGRVDEDRGSGGFAARGADVNIDLNGGGANLISWEDLGFMSSGYALTFGSPTATHMVNWTDNLSLSAADLNVVNYNAREIRVLNNPGSPNDKARISGAISGRQTNDLLKTGPGDLELTGSNTYAGATIVYDGQLFVNGNSSSSFLHRAMAGGTLSGKGVIGRVLIEAGGKITPGQVAGVASILHTGDLQFVDGTSIFSVEIGGTTAGGDSVSGYDQLEVTGTVTLSGANLEVSLLNGFGIGMGDIFFLILNDGTDPVVGQFAEGTAINIGGIDYAISYTANSANGTASGGNDVALVPEPGSALLLGLGSLLLARRSRRERA